MAKKVTPMMKQYLEIKNQYTDCILFFRLGDFYEMFNEDAKVASKILDITLTARGKHEGAIPMCGIPHHSAEGYILKLSHAGKKIAICDQVSDASLPGIVRREVVRIVTPATNLNDGYLSDRLHSRVLALHQEKETLYFAHADISTGEIFFGSEDVNDCPRLLRQIEPLELVGGEKLLESPIIYQASLQIDPLRTIQDIPRRPVDFLKTELEVQTLAGFDIDEAVNLAEVKVLTLLIAYLKTTQKQSLSHLKNIRRSDNEAALILDSTTIQNLELFYTQMEGKTAASLFATINHCKTKPGSRLLASWLIKPLRDAEQINKRLTVVETLSTDSRTSISLSNIISQTNDLARLVNKIALGHGTPRALGAIRSTLMIIPGLIELLGEQTVLSPFADKLNPLLDLTKTLQAALSEEPPNTPYDLGIVKNGYSEEIDELRKLRTHSKSVMQEFLESEQDKTGISNLKIGTNKIVGFYLEVSKGKLDLVPDYFIRKQTLTNCGRFITPELKEFEEKLLSAENKLKELEFNLCQELFGQTLSCQIDLQQNATIIAELDCYLGLAQLAVKNNYSRPVITENNNLEIINGRHPVVEKLLNTGEFVGNDIRFSEQRRAVVLTGPNMGGKSTYLRQAALITILAHMGSFVPASKATIPLTDRIFTRIGASDNLARGQSTFMVEMQELALILKQATSRSLLVIDEVGRGTATHDGISIAWAAFEHIHDEIKANTLFATHYHELIELADSLPRAHNLSMAVSEMNQEIVFLHKVIDGGMSDSYGLEVARLAGVPNVILELANKKLHEFESGTNDVKIKKNTNEDQLSMFNNTREHDALVGKIKDLNVNDLTPLDALNLLAELHKDSKAS